jgi:RNA polymerase sigma-70 factor, ECF subfamily
VVDSPESRFEPQVSADLALRIGRGDRGAEQELVRHYGRGLLYLLRRRTRDPELALDLYQDTFRIAIEKLRAGGIDEPERIAAYLHGIAVNLVIAHHRKEARRATTPDSDAIEIVADQHGGPAENVSRAQIGQAVRTLLDELPVPRDREILISVYLNEEDKDSICARLGVDSAHFNRVLFRAKQRFRDLIERAEQKGKLRLVG